MTTTMTQNNIQIKGDTLLLFCNNCEGFKLYTPDQRYAVTSKKGLYKYLLLLTLSVAVTHFHNFSVW